MYRKAQSIVEVSLLAAFVAILAISVGVIYNNQKAHLADMSKSSINTKSVNTLTWGGYHSDSRWNDKVPYKSTETAGGLSILGLSSSEFDSYMSNISYLQLDTALSTESADGKTLLERVNALETALKIPYRPIDKADINVDTLSVFTAILNQVATMQPSDLAIAGVSATDLNTYLSSINALLTEAKATLANNDIGNTTTEVAGRSSTKGQIP